MTPSAGGGCLSGAGRSVRRRPMESEATGVAGDEERLGFSPTLVGEKVRDDVSGLVVGAGDGRRLALA